MNGWLRGRARGLLSNGLIFGLFWWFYEWMTGNPVWLENSARLLNDWPDGRMPRLVLDLGAGPGNSALAMGAGRPGSRFIALDLEARMAQAARRRRSAAGWAAERLLPVQGSALALPFADGAVDAVTAHSFLYLLPAARPALREAHRVLGPGGQVAFLEPRAGRLDWGWLLRTGDLRPIVSLSLWRVYSWAHRRWTDASLAAALEQAGFVDVTTETTLGGFGLFARARKPYVE